MSKDGARLQLDINHGSNAISQPVAQGRGFLGGDQSQPAN